jgi:hypothetical protein
MRVRINTKVQLAPAATCPDAMFLVQPFALAVNFQAGTIDKKMQRFIRRMRLGKTISPPPLRLRVV